MPIYQVICLGPDTPKVEPCGPQPLTEREYLAQLSYPDSTWRCPRCGCEAEWDDSSETTNPPDDAVIGDEDDIPF